MTHRYLRLFLSPVVSLILAQAIGFGQESNRKSDTESVATRVRPDKRAEWMRRGREAPEGVSAAGLRLRAYRQKMALRAKRQIAASIANGAPSALGWVALGPAPLVSDNNSFGMVSGRATSVAMDPTDATGNTVYVGGAYGGVWKSTNAAAVPSSNVTWTPVTDSQASLATGAVSVKPDGTVVLVGTGEPNNAIDSYYGAGILRSTDSGSTWTLIPSADGGSHPFAGLGVAKFAWSAGSGQTNIVVAAAATTAKGFEEGNITSSTNRGLYQSANGGLTWAFQGLPDGGPISATDVLYNPIEGKFVAAVRRHGLYTSLDGTNWGRMPNQPTPLTMTCSAQANCPIYRAQVAIVLGRDEMYMWFIDLDSGNNVVDEGIWRSISGGTWSQISEAGLTDCGDLEGCGASQAFYNLEIAALPDGSGITDLYAGAVNLYKCRLLNSSTTCSTIDANLPNAWLNLTHVYGICSDKAQVHPSEHGIDFAVVGGKALLYFANDGGVYRAIDGYSGLNIGSCNTAGNNAFDNLNGSLGSLTQFVSFSTHPTDGNTVLGGSQGNGSPASNAATSSSQWITVNGGDGGYNIINPVTPTQWFTANTDVSIQVCNSGIGCDTNAFAPVVTNATVGGDAGPFYTPYILDPQNASEFLVGTCRVWRGSTSGTAFSTLSVNFDVLSNSLCTGNEFNLVRGLAAGGPTQNNFSNVVYATTEGSGPNCTGTCGGPFGGEVWATTNAATTQMSNVTGTINPLNYTISSVAVDSSVGDGKTGYVGIMGFVGTGTAHVYKTSNAGQTWIPFGSDTQGLPDAPVNTITVDSNSGQVYAGTDVGVFVSSTSSAGWTEVGPAAQPGATGYLPNVPVSAIRLFNSGASKKLRASTYGRGIWEYDLATSPDYQLAVSNTPLVSFPSQTAVFTGTLTSQNGYPNAVTLSCGTGAPGACTIPGNPITPTAGGAVFNVSMNSGGAPQDYNFNVHGVGADGHSITHDAAVKLQVVDFGLGTPVPSTVTAQQGGASNTTSFQVAGLGSFAGSVTLSCQGTVITAGATCIFSPSATVNPTSVSPVDVSLTVSVPNSVAIKSYSITIQATSTGAPAPETQTLTLEVIAPVGDFSLAVTASPNASLAHSTVAWSGTLTAVNGYNKSVTLSCTAGKPGTCTFTPSTLVPTSGGAGFTVTVGNTSVGDFDFTIEGTDGTLTHASPGHLTVNTDVTLPGSLADASVQPGQTATTSLNVAPFGGPTFSGAVIYACSGLPAGLTCAFNPSQIAAGGSATTVGVSIKTAGPFTGTPVRRRGQNRGRWLLLGLPLAGLVLAGVAGCGKGRRLQIAMFCGMLGLAATMLACGGIGGGSTAPPPPTISVTVNPTSVNTLYPNLNSAPPQTQQFTAVVHNATNQAVTWTVAGGAANGTIDSSSGLYTAPGAVPGGTVTATATAVADITKSANAAVNILTPTPSGTSAITVTVTEATQPQAQHTVGFNLTVQ
ncbi:MAG TPA: hypothetical protein VNW47_17040 [Terriglobales bacterium]|jgi:hypothetical protein|nr:hypothetical protein [Terriglobales bacterium]